MDNALTHWVAQYACKSSQDYINALKEIIQEIALLGLWRHKFFEKAAFYGGTALRILYGLDRFSEDLDFSLLTPLPHFNLAPYLQGIAEELASFGLKASVQTKVKTKISAIQSAFIKAHTLEHLLQIGLPQPLQKKLHSEELLKVRIELDTDPPLGADTEAKYLLTPSPFSVVTYQLPDLFAGKLHALLCREWKGRVKGRDWYDLVWFISKKVPVRLQHLAQRMQQTGHLKTASLTHEMLLSLLQEKIARLHIAQAKADILPFLKDHSKVALWSADFFLAIIQRLQIL